MSYDPHRRLHPDGAPGANEMLHRQFLGDHGYETAVAREAEAHRERIAGARARTKVWERLSTLLSLAVFAASLAMWAAIIWAAGVAWQAVTG